MKDIEIKQQGSTNHQQLLKILNPRKIADYLDDYVIGQVSIVSTVASPEKGAFCSDIQSLFED